MKKFIVALALALGLQCTALYAQSVAPQTEAELTAQTALLKAQQAYYDQLLATAKSQQAAADASVAAQTSSQTAASQLQSARLTEDLAVSTAIKGSGLSAAVGKDGTITITSADKSLLAMQRGSLEVIDSLSTIVCNELSAKLPQDQGQPVQLFIAPANYETLVQKSIADIVQLSALHDAAVNGTSDYGNVRMQVAGAALAGAMVTAQYLAGGVQALTKLFRTDYNVTFTAANRQGLFEQTLGATCKSEVLSNVEGKLRLNAAKILFNWLPDLAKFVQLNDMWSENVTQRKTDLTTKRTTAATDKTLTDTQMKAVLKELDDSLKSLLAQEQVLSKYKTVATAIKTYLAGLGSSTVYDSMVWGQGYLQALGGLPADVDDLKLGKRPRLTYTLNVQDATVKASSTFFADKLRAFSTAELYYSLVAANGDILATGTHSISTTPVDMKVKELTVGNYSKTY